MSYLNGETQKDFDTLTAVGWQFSGADTFRRCRNGWTGRCGAQTVQGETLEMAVRAAQKLHAKDRR